MSLHHIAMRLRYAVSNPHGWQQFLDEKYEGGKAQVPNPNHTTAKKYPQVSVNHAMKDEHYRKHIEEEYHKWYGENKDKAKNRGRPKKVNQGDKPAPEKKPSDLRTALMGEYTIGEFLDNLPPKLSGNPSPKVTQKVKNLQDRIDSTNRSIGLFVSRYEKAISVNDTTAKKSYMSRLIFATNDLNKSLMVIEEMGGTSQELLNGLSYYYNPDLFRHQDKHPDGISVDFLTTEWQRSSRHVAPQIMQKYLSSLGVSGTKGDKDDWDDPPLDPHGPVYNADMVRASIKDNVSKMYAYQQAVFKHMGLTHITLYRGLSSPDIDEDPPSHGTKVKMKTRPACSYSASPEVANSFGHRIVKCVVPVENILMSAAIDPKFDGESIDAESEFVVLGADSIESELFSTTGRYVDSSEDIETKYKDQIAEIKKLYGLGE